MPRRFKPEKKPLPVLSPPETRTPLGLLLGTLGVRCLVLLFWPDTLTADPDGYRAVAENLVRHGVFGSGDSPTAYRPPLYPLLLAPCVGLASDSRAAIGIGHLGLGLATVWLTCRVGRMCGLGRWTWLAALLVACDPILLAQSTLVMTETLAAFLAVASVFWIGRTGQTGRTRHALAAGAAVGLAILCRPTFLPWGGAIALLFVSERRATKDKVRLGLAFAGAVGLVLLPWAARNHTRFGRPILTTTHGGYTLLLANNPYFFQHLRDAPWGALWENEALDRHWAAEMPRGTPADEVEADRLAYAKAMQAIRNEPGMFFYACLVRFGRLFALLPRQIAAHESVARRFLRCSVAVWYAAELALAAYGAVVVARRFRHLDNPTGWIASALLVACFAAVHSLFWTDMRMRAPLMPVIAAFAAVGAMALGDLRLVNLRRNRLLG